MVTGWSCCPTDIRITQSGGLSIPKAHAFWESPSSFWVITRLSPEVGTPSFVLVSVVS